MDGRLFFFSNDLCELVYYIFDSSKFAHCFPPENVVFRKFLKKKCNLQ